MSPKSHPMPFNQYKYVCVIDSYSNSDGYRLTLSLLLLTQKPFFGQRRPRSDFRNENKRSLVRSSTRPIFFSKIDDSHCDRIHSSLTALRCFGNGYVRKAACGLERILCGALVKRTPGKHG